MAYFQAYWSKKNPANRIVPEDLGLWLWLKFSQMNIVYRKLQHYQFRQNLKVKSQDLHLSQFWPFLVIIAI